MQTAIKGRLTMEAAASPGLFTNIIATTAQMVIKSGIRVVTQLDSTSFRELMSPIIRARIFPVGRLSKNWKSRGLDMGIQLLADGDKDAVAHFCHHIHTKLDSQDHNQVQDNGK